jgi:hypothetical protein
MNTRIIPNPPPPPARIIIEGRDPRMVMPIPHRKETRLTGKKRYRRQWFTGLLILQVQYEFSITTAHPLNVPYFNFAWRDATIYDLMGSGAWQ